MADPVLYKARARAAWLTLNAPAVHNALGPELVGGLDTALARAIADEAVRVIVLAGAGRSFCAGLDLKSGSDAFRRPGDGDAPSPYERLVRAFWECPKPIIGRIQGGAFGAGFGLVLCCDLAVAAETAEFAVTELYFGMPPTLIPLMLHHRQLLGAVRPLLFTGERFDARRAEALHIVHEVAAAPQLDETVAACGARLLKCAPGALATAKTIQRALPAMTFAEGLAFAAGHLSRALSSSEAREGFAAFGERRAPRWTA